MNQMAASFDASENSLSVVSSNIRQSPDMALSQEFSPFLFLVLTLRPSRPLR
jgi:hypothetical protein